MPSNHDNFMIHAERAVDAYRKYRKMKERVDRYESEKITKWGTPALAYVDMKDLPDYRVMAGTRNFFMQEVQLELLMAQLYRDLG